MIVSTFSNQFASAIEKLSGRWQDGITGPQVQDNRSSPAEMEGSSTAGAFGQITPPTDDTQGAKFKKKDVTQDWLEAIENK